MHLFVHACVGRYFSRRYFYKYIAIGIIAIIIFLTLSINAQRKEKIVANINPKLRSILMHVRCACKELDDQTI